MADGLQEDGWQTPADYYGADADAHIGDFRRPQARITLGIPALDEVARVSPNEGQIIVIALPWEPAGETPFVVAQALARQKTQPLCLYPSWSPFWDGALTVYRPQEMAQSSPVPYDTFEAQARAGGHSAVVIDQFSRLHWDAVSSHAAREDVVSEASRALHFLAKKASVPVVVFLRRRTQGIIRMSVDDLRSDGALEYEAEVLVMVDPHPETGTADVLVVKHRNGPTGLRTAVAWPVLPRTIHRRTP